jgi:thiamine monophosphate synthase
MSAAQVRRLRRIAVARDYRLVMEADGEAVRVHNVQELTRALLRRPEMVLLSPIYETPTHPLWQALPRMRAATLARLCKRNAVALGGMSATRFERLERLGFRGWAGISAFRT